MSGISIMGYDVVFPEGMKPFPSQLAVLSKCLTAFSKNQNVLIESPTGTGKTLALLTAALTYQKKEYDSALKSHREKYGESPGGKENSRVGHNTPTERHLNDVRIHNLLSFPRIYYCSRTHSQIQQVVEELREMSGIFLDDLHTTILASRTHMCVNSQVRQDAEVNHITIDAACDDALKKNKCSHKFNVIPVVQSLSSRVGKLSVAGGSRGVTAPQSGTGCSGDSAGGRLLKCNSVWDIEDIVASGKKNRGCSYFASRAGIIAGGAGPAAAAAAVGEVKTESKVDRQGMAADSGSKSSSSSAPVFPKSHVVFAPYNYMFNPDIREGLGIDLKNSILVVDEAHNVEDICREEMSVDITMESLQVTMHRLYAILNHVSGMGNLPHFKAFHQLCSDLLVWVRSTSAVVSQGSSSGGGGFQGQGRGGGSSASAPENVWHGEEIMETLAGCCGLSAESLPMYQEHFNRMKEQEDISYGLAMHTIAQQELAGGEKQKQGQGQGSNRAGALDEQDEWQLPKPSVSLLSGLLRTAKLLCDNNAEYASDFKMVLLVDPFADGKPNNSSGIKLCLWCMNPAIAFQSIKSQCSSIVLASGTLSPLSSFSAELDTPFSVRLEAPHVINVQNQVHVQALAKFNQVSMNASYANQNNPEYHAALGELMRLTVKLTPGGLLLFFPSYGLLTKMKNSWSRSGLMQDLSNDHSGAGAEVFVEPKDAKSLETVLKSYYGSIDSGRKAVLLAVCRGKVSEGINFANDYARCIMIVGIPYPAAFDLAVQLKKKHQDERVSKWIAARKKQQEAGTGAAAGLDATINGSEWYKLQAFRAINQALGRCIRHIRDYGSILLCDPRYQEGSTQAQLSRWVRSGIRSTENFEDGVLPFHSFFKEAESFINSKYGTNAAAASTFLAREHARLNPVRTVVGANLGRSASRPGGSLVKKFKVPSSTSTHAPASGHSGSFNSRMSESEEQTHDKVIRPRGNECKVGLKKPFKIPKTVGRDEGDSSEPRRGTIMAAFSRLGPASAPISASAPAPVMLPRQEDPVHVCVSEPSSRRDIGVPHAPHAHPSIQTAGSNNSGFVVTLSDTEEEDEEEEEDDQRVFPPTATDSDPAAVSVDDPMEEELWGF